MPRGKFVNHKGRSRKFTSPEELQRESSSEEETSSENEEEVAGATGSTLTKTKLKQKKAPNESSSEEGSEESEEDDRDAKKGVAGLIEIENPNRAVKKATQKVSNITISEDAASGSKPELSRREREQIEKQKQRQRYKKLHAEGKTTEAKSDLARLAIIRQQRAEAAAKREAEKNALETKKSGAGSKA